jgi:hypothetical protein
VIRAERSVLSPPLESTTQRLLLIGMPMCPAIIRRVTNTRQKRFSGVAHAVLACSSRTVMQGPFATVVICRASLRLYDYRSATLPERVVVVNVDPMHVIMWGKISVRKQQKAPRRCLCQRCKHGGAPVIQGAAEWLWGRCLSFPLWTSGVRSSSCRPCVFESASLRKARELRESLPFWVKLWSEDAAVPGSACR